MTLSYSAAFLLRFEWPIPRPFDNVYLSTLPWILACRLVTFSYFRVYRGSWRYVGMRDLVTLLKTVIVSSLAFIGVLIFVPHPAGFPRSVIVLDAVLTVMIIGGARFGLRALRERARTSPQEEQRSRRVMIIGAGDAGELLLREIASNPRLRLSPVGFVDDDINKVGTQIHGVEVLGTTSRLSDVLALHPADELVIAIPSAPRRVISEIVNRCLQTGLPFKIVPAIAALADGELHLKQLRPVRIEDLLGREPVELDHTMLEGTLTGASVVITGAGGSIGSELARQIAAYNPSLLTLLERNENGLYVIEQELRRKFPTLKLAALICDVSDEADVKRVFATAQPKVVYHAAAYKHVPLMESHLLAAVQNNVFGTLTVARATAEYGGKFVLISTDKAVAPTNVMGASKRLAERIVLWHASESRGHFVAVRFGNVLGSNGSVVPLFTQQIADGGPVTVTHPDATRYFMTIPEAVQLVLQASVLDESNDRIAMLEMGEPVRIVDLARNLIRLSGFEPGEDIAIAFTGLRPGEKLHEQLLSESEETLPTRYEKIRLVRAEAAPSLEKGLRGLRDAVESRDERQVLRLMQELVPEFRPQAELIARLRDRGAPESWARSRTAR